MFVGTDDATQADTITIRQPSNLIQAPTGLETRPAGQGVELVWRAPLEGAPLLANDFEGDDSLDGWLIENSDDRGWQRQQSGKHSWTKAHGGTRSVWLNYGWDPVSEDQRLTSPSFAGGSWLTFWSKSTAPGSISPVYHYVVEASADGGQTWHTAFDLIKEGKAKNRYEQITVDLGPYRSDNMKIRFHAWDESEGLAYWWTIDDVAVYPEAAGSMVEGYNIYRDGTKLNSEPLNVSNYLDKSGSTSSSYQVQAVVRGVPQQMSDAVTPWANNYLEVQMDHGNLKSTYIPNDACMADVDGDGELEILLKFDNQEDIAGRWKKGGNNGEYAIIEVYKLNGKRLWWIDLGPNMADFQNNENNIVAYDWDGDGKAEAVLRASDGTVVHKADGTTVEIGDMNADYRPAGGHTGGLVLCARGPGVPALPQWRDRRALPDNGVSAEKA